jgi:aspartate/methionine/tyrosine aminotransferase
MPDGAFYAWADCSAACDKLGLKDSWRLSFALMQQAHVAVTPGRDFGRAGTERYIRLSTASALPQLRAAVERLRQLLT